jgi:hypothetical protein
MFGPSTHSHAALCGVVGNQNEVDLHSGSLRVFSKKASRADELQKNENSGFTEKLPDNCRIKPQDTSRRSKASLKHRRRK